MGNDESSQKDADFKKFAMPRIIGGIAIAVIVLWLLSLILGSKNETPSENRQEASRAAQETTPHADVDEAGRGDTDTGNMVIERHVAIDDTMDSDADDIASHHDADADVTATDQQHTVAASHDTTEDLAGGPLETTEHETPAEHESDSQASSMVDKKESALKTTSHASKSAATDDESSENTEHGKVAGQTLHEARPIGVAFVEAAIKPLQYELEERWFGWRPNDLIEITDNVNNFQMGVLEVSRRTIVALTERISRTGSTDSFDTHLEQAMNWLMVKAGSYWLPSAESKYKEALEEMEVYLEKLKDGKATFYTRADNLIPLLSAFEDLLGSCDENLVKTTEEDGSPVSFFVVDDYFYYSQGVASAMATILEAVHHDFFMTLESRHGTELLHHAIVSCQRAAAIEPWVVLDSDMDSVFANHRANMAAPISHARFYIGLLIKTLST